ncbi:molybdate ABC transporter substrate-binding protein [Stakelama saccharophila]|uniref:Molybdate ABC transporter substrate-binding protein n=1 Tax=Stakelama saccharophila TaxID=3075605 RepID=A0ABZ0BA10_9SPHN|nr:molybdate ABC transporter substrate-binding protein [Stakelama sp. W311]WNO53154.1 molybdate ABC transporter substrate-binding protein [Stakelama sp. W311]
MRKWIAALILALFVLVSGPATAARRGPLVLAAASLQESMNAAADAWAKQGHPRPVLSFAGSSALARQAAAGAPADLFVSADEAWMDYLEKRGRLMPGTRATFLANRLVLITPAHSRATVTLRKGAPLARMIGDGRIAMASYNAVPAGKYGKAALQSLGIWDAVRPKVAQADNVRAALALVERGATPFGITYATDARASDKVRIAGVFPASSHPPIRYPVARLKTSTNPDAEGFRRFLLSKRAAAIFRHYGFTPR